MNDELSAGGAAHNAELDDELEAMRKIDASLAALPRETGARERVLRWACDKYRVTPPAAPEADQ